MRKYLAFLLSFLVAAGLSVPLKKASAEEGKVLNVMNWEDYIGEDVIAGFEEEYKANHGGEEIKVSYSTQGTNENMYTELVLNKNVRYDLVCPSEYMIQKMIVEDMLEPLDRKNHDVKVYDEGVSPYIANLFKRTKINGKPLYDYACCYMWGTMGYVYRPDKVDGDEIKSWDAIWLDKYKNKSTIKNSVRDSYVLAIGYAKREELTNLAKDREEKRLSDEEYNKKLTAIFNDVTSDSLLKASNALSLLTPKLYGFEIDSGKIDMATGKIYINFAWSGDAVYALDYAEDPEEVGEENVSELKYVVPKEGSNIFFDGWVMPKGADVELAQEFLNYIERPDIAFKNMDYIGYTTSIATDEIFDILVSHEEDGYDYGYTKEEVSFDEDGNPYIGDGDEKTLLYAHDLSYFFEGEGGKKSESRNRDDYIIYNDVANRDRQLDTQYPDYETVTRCTIMRHFDDRETKALSDMWLDVVAEGNEELKNLYLAVVLTLLAAVLLTVIRILDKRGLFNRRKIKKGYKIIAVNGKKYTGPEE